MPYVGLMRVQEYAGEGLDILFLSGPFKDARGEWNIVPGRPLKLTYRMHMDLMKSPFPPPLAPAIAEQQVRTWVEVFEREMERRKAK
jgi:ribosome-associated toxin RatA of RatAB toxin-antitoxin module